MKARALLSAGAIALGMGLFTGCSSSPPGTTCDQFAALSQSAQDGSLNSLLRAHGKEDGPIAGMTNRIQLKSEVDIYCGISPGLDGGAHSHGTDPIDDAADWS